MTILLTNKELEREFENRSVSNPFCHFPSAVRRPTDKLRGKNQILNYLLGYNYVPKPYVSGIASREHSSRKIVNLKQISYHRRILVFCKTISASIFPSIDGFPSLWSFPSLSHKLNPKSVAGPSPKKKKNENKKMDYLSRNFLFRVQCFHFSVDRSISFTLVFSVALS